MRHHYFRIKRQNFEVQFQKKNLHGSPRLQTATEQVASVFLNEWHLKDLYHRFGWADDSVYLNLYQKGDKKEIDIDEEFEISAIKSIIYDTGSFYTTSFRTRPGESLATSFLVRMDECLETYHCWKKW